MGTYRRGTACPIPGGVRGVVVRDDVELAGLSREERQKLLEEETRPIPPRLAGRGSLGPALMGGNFAARREVLLRVGASTPPWWTEGRTTTSACDCIGQECPSSTAAP